MPQSLANVIIHIVFSTKNRRPLLNDQVRGETIGYLVKVIEKQGCNPIQVGLMPDHVHILLGISRTLSLAKIIEELKTSSSKWLKGKGISDFSWQVGYGAFSVSAGDKSAVIAYIQNQQEHHRKYSFQDELRRLLDQSEITYDERYLWD